MHSRFVFQCATVRAFRHRAFTLGESGSGRSVDNYYRKGIAKGHIAKGHTLCILAAMIAHQLGMKIATAMTERIGRAELSYEKLCDLLVNQLVKVREFSQLVLFDPDERHIRRDKRTRKSPIESGIMALT